MNLKELLNSSNTNDVKIALNILGIQNLTCDDDFVYIIPAHGDINETKQLLTPFYKEEDVYRRSKSSLSTNKSMIVLNIIDNRITFYE